jgi:hypothetical protein
MDNAKGDFGFIVPCYKDIIGIDGDALIDANCNVFNKDLVKLNKHFGGRLELIDLSLEDDEIE